MLCFCAAAVNKTTSTVTLLSSDPADHADPTDTTDHNDPTDPTDYRRS
jgi:hypothetical protein